MSLLDRLFFGDDERAQAARRAKQRLVRALQCEHVLLSALVMPEHQYRHLVAHSIRLATRDLAALGLGAQARAIIAAARQPRLRAGEVQS